MRIINKLLLTTASSCLIVGNASANLVANGTFETPRTGSYVSYPAGSTNLAGWTVDTAPSDGVQLGRPGTFSGRNNGSQNVQLTGGTTGNVGGGIHQTIITTVGQVYDVSVDVASRNGANIDGALTAISGLSTNQFDLNASGPSFATEYFSFTASNAATLIDVTGYTNSSGQLLIDNVVILPHGTAPSMVSQPPSGVTNYAGDSPKFLATAEGSPPLSYQWYFDTNNLTSNPGNDTDWLQIPNVQTTDAGTYSLVVSNAFGSITSSVVVLTVLSDLLYNGNFEAPVVGGFSSYGPGSSALTSWAVDTTPPDGVQQGNAFGASDGTQIVQLTGGANYGTGGGINQYIYPPTVGQLYDVTIDIASRHNNRVDGLFSIDGFPHALSTSSSTFATVTWQIVATNYYQLVDITGATNSPQVQLVIDNVHISPSAKPGSKPTINVQPASVTNYVNDNRTLSVATTGGTEPFVYQWYKGTTLVGSGDPITLNNLQTTDSGNYSVVVGNSFGSVTGSVATLSVFAASPGITWLSTNISSFAGATLTLQPTVVGAQPFTYQWYFNTGTALTDATNGSLTIGYPSTVGDSGAYTLVATNSFGWTTSQVAQVTIKPNLTLNWGFELPAIGNYASYYYGDTTLTNWDIDQVPGDGVQLSIPGAFANGGTGQNLQLTANYSQGGGINQMLNTTPGQFYRLSVDAAARNSNTIYGQFIFGSVSNLIVATSRNFTNIVWYAYATSTTTLLDLQGNTNSSFDQLAIDNVLVVPASVGPQLSIQPNGPNLILTWLSGGTLEAADNVQGPYTSVVSATSPYTVTPPLSATKFYRIAY